MNAVGADILEISRMRRLLENDYFMHRVFSAREREYIASKCTAAAQSAAGIFCAKEAFIKATGVTGLSMMRKIEVLHTPSGAPYFSVPDDMRCALGARVPALSISHCREYAMAVAVFDACAAPEEEQQGKTFV